MNLHVGDPAPSFQAEAQDGQIYDLEDFAGQWVVLYFYPKDDTSGCTKEACSFRDNMSQLKEKAVVLGVSADTLESHKKFAEKYHLNYPLLADPEKTIIKAYDVNGPVFAKRTTFIISPEGIISKVYEGVNPEQHAEEILRDILQLQSNQTITPVVE